MFKKVMSVCLCLALVLGFAPTIMLVSEPETVSAGVYKMPDTNGKTNNQTYILGEGTDVNVPVYTDWRSTSLSPTATMTPKYIAIHCTGAYPSTSTAKANHNYGKTAESACWHYTVGDTDIYQLLADNRQGWHVGTSYTGAPSNSNSIGLELAVNNFPATETFGGEQWSDGTAIMEWWDNQFHQTVKNAAYLTAVLCERWGLDWQTRVKMHWDSKSYQSGAAGKDCPMQMRATYDPATNTFSPAGQYVDGRDGYFWQIFWDYLGKYVNGASNVGSGSTASKLGTYQITSSDGLNVRTGASTSYDMIGTLESGAVTEVTELSGSWGKASLPDGQVGWAAVGSYADYIGVDALAYTLDVNSDGMQYSYDSDGGLVVTNTNTTDQGQMDLKVPNPIGNLTTKYMSLQVTPISGNGYYFGITQYGSGYFMMRDCSSGDQLVNATTAPYMTNMETLEIDISEWWRPEENYKIDQVRFYLAPNTSIKINYFYFAEDQGKVIDTRYNLRSKSTNVNLMQPDTLAIADTTKKGSYVYNNGLLSITADTDAGFDVVFNVNETFEIEKFKRFLVAIDAATSFNISLTVTNAVGTGTISLVSDFYPSFTETYPADGYIPGPWTGSAGLDLYNYYAYNQIVPTDGMSTISQVKVSLGGAGTSHFSSIQIAENDRLLNFYDGIKKEESCTGVSSDSSGDKVVFESTVYSVNTDLVGNIAADTSVTAFFANVTSDYTVTVYENGVAVSGDTLVKTGQTVTVSDGTTQLASYQIAVVGDTNCDGKLSTMDVREILKSLANTAFTGALVTAADFDASGEVSTADARDILKALAA